MVVATNFKKLLDIERAINKKLGNSQNNLKAQRAEKTTLSVNWVAMFVP